MVREVLKETTGGGQVAVIKESDEERQDREEASYQRARSRVGVVTPTVSRI
jgi:hypothetical protein